MKAGKRERVRGLENINRVFPGENSLIRGGEGGDVVCYTMLNVFNPCVFIGKGVCSMEFKRSSMRVCKPEL